jgi:hypothetical protein
MILALEDDLGVKFSGKRVELKNKKYQVLVEQEYQEVSDQVLPMLTAMLELST